MAGDGSGYVGQQILGAGMVIAIDGPSGAGKTTVARMAAAELGTNFLDTGAMYRAVTWSALQQGIDLSDKNALGQLAASIPLVVHDEAHAPRILIDGKDVTRLIRTTAVTDAVSQVSAVPQVRAEMIGRQKRLIQGSRNTGRGVVVEGRDITTVVAPDADVRILLTASEEVREQRRGAQEGEANAAVGARDAADSQVNNFTTPAPGVVLLDSTNLDINETVAEVVRITAEAYRDRG